MKLLIPARKIHGVLFRYQVSIIGKQFQILDYRPGQRTGGQVCKGTNPLYSGIKVYDLHGLQRLIKGCL